MTSAIPATAPVLTLPDHTQLPESDGTFVKNFQEHPQSILLTESIRPVLEQRHPDGQYCIGQDSGIYWRLIDPPEKGAESPDWFYVPNVPPTLEGKLRRSYVLWKEYVAPLIAIEFVSGDGSEERDRTPPSQSEGQKVGKFWVYEKAIRIPYYAIYEAEKAQVEVYHLQDDTYQRIVANVRGHYPIPPLGVELGIWHGTYQNAELPWLRWWDAEGHLLPHGEEQAKQAKQQAEQAQQQAEQAQQQAEQAQQQAEQAKQQAEQAQQRAEQAQQRAERLQQERSSAISRLVTLGMELEQIAEVLGLPVAEVQAIAASNPFS